MSHLTHFDTSTKYLPSGSMQALIFKSDALGTSPGIGGLNSILILSAGVPGNFTVTFPLTGDSYI